MNYRPVQLLMSGNPSAANGTAYFYEVGTTTGKTMYDEDSVSIGTSKALDAYGSAGVYGTGLVKIVIKNSSGSTIATYDNVDIDFGGWPSGHFYDIAATHGARNSTALAAAITAVGTDKVNLYFDDGAWTITANHTIDANSRVVFHPNAVLTISASKVLTFHNSNTDGFTSQQHFAGSGTVSWTYGSAKVNPVWWGTDPTGTVSSSSSINAAIASLAGGGFVNIAHDTHDFGYLQIVAQIVPFGGVALIGQGCAEVGNGRGTKLFRGTGASGVMFETTTTADYLEIKDLFVDCDFKGTDGFKLGYNTNAWQQGVMENVEVIDCAGIGIDVTASNSVMRNIKVTNADGGGVGTHQVRIAGSDCNIYNLRITGEAGSTANIELSGDNINIYGLYIEDPNLTKCIRISGDNNHIYGCHIKTEDNTKTYTQLVYLESGATGNSIQGLEIEKGATDTITNAIQDDQYSRTIPYWALLERYEQSNSYYFGTLTRDMTAASGDVSYTGVGFMPRAVVFLAVKDTSTFFSVGFGDDASSYDVHHTSAADTFESGATTVIDMIEGVGKSQLADIKTLDADGFTLTWTKAGATAAGTAKVYYLAMR